MQYLILYSGPMTLTSFKDDLFPMKESLQVLIIIFNGNILSLNKFTLMLGHEFRVDLELWCFCIFTQEDQIWLIGQPSREPQEWFLEVVVAPCGQVVILQVSLAMELNVSGLDLPVLHVDLVSNEDDWNVLANANYISMPVRYVLVGNSASNIEHDDGALTLDIITVSETAEFLLTSCIPHIEADLPAVCVEL